MTARRLPPAGHWAAAIVAAYVAEIADAAIVSQRGPIDLDQLVADGWTVDPGPPRYLGGKRLRTIRPPHPIPIAGDPPCSD